MYFSGVCAATSWQKPRQQGEIANLRSSPRAKVGLQAVPRLVVQSTNSVLSRWCGVIRYSDIPARAAVTHAYAFLETSNLQQSPLPAPTRTTA
jgi:hypothetical protein